MKQNFGFLKRSTKSTNHWIDGLRRKREKIQFNKTINESEDITINSTKIKRIIRILGRIYANKLDNLD